MSDTPTTPIVLTAVEAQQLRDALRIEQQSKEAHELTALRARVASLEATSARRAVFESIADAHNFDATDAFTFDYQSRTLTIQKGHSHGATA